MPNLAAQDLPEDFGFLFSPRPVRFQTMSRHWSKHDLESRGRLAVALKGLGRASFEKHIRQQLLRGKEPRAKEIYKALECVSSVGDDKDEFDEAAYIEIFLNVADILTKQPIQRCAACLLYLDRPLDQIFYEGENEDNTLYNIQSRCGACNRCVCPSMCISIRTYSEDDNDYYFCSATCKVTTLIATTNYATTPTTHHLDHTE